MSLEIDFYVDIMHAIDAKSMKEMMKKSNHMPNYTKNIFPYLSEEAIDKIIDHPNITLIYEGVTQLLRNLNIKNRHVILLAHALIKNRKQIHRLMFHEAVVSVGQKIISIKNKKILEPLYNYREIDWAIVANKTTTLTKCQEILKEARQAFENKRRSKSDLLCLMRSAAERIPEQTADIVLSHRKILSDAMYEVDFPAQQINLIWQMHKDHKNLKYMVSRQDETPSEVLDEAWSDNISDPENIEYFVKHRHCSLELFCRIWDIVKKSRKKNWDEDFIKTRRPWTNQPWKFPQRIAEEILKRNSGNLKFLQNNYYDLSSALDEGTIDSYIAVAKLEI